jgi:Dolichyl-phosphate-mannose-protein mannosyltransferase
MKLLQHTQGAHPIAIEDMETMKLAVVVQREKVNGHKIALRDVWLLAIVFVASVVSFGVTTFYYNNNEMLLYNDAYEHLIIPRRVIDNITPGFDQLGAGWLPLQHVLMLPFIWNDYLWHTGLAGTIPSMISYVIAIGYLFCALRRLTRQTVASLIGVIIFLCNPNILYLQAVPLTEVMCAAAFAATAYYLLRWLQSYEQKYLIYTAIATLTATLIRYDGWALFLVVSIIVIAARPFRKKNRDMIIDQIMVYLSIAPLGLLFWFIWNTKLSGDPLYFQRGPYSAQAQQLDFLHKGELPTYHNMVVSLRVYSIDVGQTIGWGIFIAAVVSLALVLVVYRKRRECFILAVMLVPFVFYVISLYMGQSIIELPGVANLKYFFNVRYGAQMVLPAAFLIAWGSALLFSWVRHWPFKTLLLVVCLIGISAQVIDIDTVGIISLQDGLVGISCNNPAEPVIVSLAQRYNGGRILVDEATSVINPQLFDTHFSNIIWEGSGDYWKNALAQPTRFVNWVVLNPSNPDDTVARVLTRNRQEFLSSFMLVSSNPKGLQLYYRIGAPPLPTRPIPDNLLKRPHTCKLNE